MNINGIGSSSCSVKPEAYKYAIEVKYKALDTRRSSQASIIGREKETRHLELTAVDDYDFGKLQTGPLEYVRSVTLCLRSQMSKANS